MSEDTALDDVESEVEEAPEDEIVVLAQKWKKKRGSLIMALHELQGRLGYVPRESAMKLGREMGVPLANIYEVLTFYNYFKLESPGKYIISVCTGTACYVRGAEKVLDEFMKELDIKVGETTTDGRFSINCLRCVGACGLAPVVLVGEKVYGRVSPDGVKSILAEYKK